MSPLNILPKTHLGGAAHTLIILLKKMERLFIKRIQKKNIITKNKVLTGSAGDTWF